VALGLKLACWSWRREGIEAAFAALSQDKPDALLVASDPIFDVHRDKLVALWQPLPFPRYISFATSRPLVA